MENDAQILELLFAVINRGAPHRPTDRSNQSVTYPPTSPNPTGTNVPSLPLLTPQSRTPRQVNHSSLQPAHVLRNSSTFPAATVSLPGMEQTHPLTSHNPAVASSHHHSPSVNRALQVNPVVPKSLPAQWNTDPKHPCSSSSSGVVPLPTGAVTAARDVLSADEIGRAMTHPSHPNPLASNRHRLPFREWTTEQSIVDNFCRYALNLLARDMKSNPDCGRAEGRLKAHIKEEWEKWVKREMTRPQLLESVVTFVRASAPAIAALDIVRDFKLWFQQKYKWYYRQNARALNDLAMVLLRVDQIISIPPQLQHVQRHVHTTSTQSIVSRTASQHQATPCVTGLDPPANVYSRRRLTLPSRNQLFTLPSRNELFVIGLFCKHSKLLAACGMKNKPGSVEAENRLGSHIDKEWARWVRGNITKLQILQSVGRFVRAVAPETSRIDALQDFKVWYEREYELQFQTKAPTGTRPNREVTVANWNARKARQLQHVQSHFQVAPTNQNDFSPPAKFQSQTAPCVTGLNPPANVLKQFETSVKMEPGLDGPAKAKDTFTAAVGSTIKNEPRTDVSVGLRMMSRTGAVRGGCSRGILKGLKKSVGGVAGFSRRASGTNDVKTPSGPTAKSTMRAVPLAGLVLSPHAQNSATPPSPPALPSSSFPGMGPTGVVATYDPESNKGLSMSVHKASGASTGTAASVDGAHAAGLQPEWNSGNPNIPKAGDATNAGWSE